MYMNLKLDQVHHYEGWVHVNHAKLKFKVCRLLLLKILIECALRFILV